MRASRTLLLAVGAVAAAGLLDMAASAAGFSLRRSTTSSTSDTSSTATSSTVAPATSLAVAPVGSTSSSSAPAQSGATREEVTVALFALAAGGHTLAGPGTFLGGVDDDTRIYQVLTAPAADVCVTVRNLSRGQIRVSATGAASIDVEAGETRAACYAAPLFVDLDCREGTACEGVWRVDRR